MIDQIILFGGFVLEIFLIVTIVDIFLIGLPIPKFVKKLEQEHFIITKPNHSEKQGKVECSAYALAYVFRHLGKNVTGQQLYQEMPCKAPNGYVFCRGIVNLARKYGFHARFHIGNLTALKNTIAKGVPAIVMVHSNAHSNTFHYIALVGYDKENIYAIDSARKVQNSSNEHYNRIIPINEFKKLWNTSLLRHPLFFNLFFDINLK